MTSNMHQLDHIVLGIADLDEGIRQLEELTGARAVYGGEHPHWGTHNALISLGDRTYLEILSPRPGKEIAAALRHLKEIDCLTPVMWAVATGDVKKTAAVLEDAGFAVGNPTRGSRKTGDGATLEWTVLNLEDFGSPSVPFFIEWSEMTSHPSQSAPEGCILESLSVTAPEPSALRALVEKLGLDVSVREGEPPSLEVRLECQNGGVSIS